MADLFDDFGIDPEGAKSPDLFDQFGVNPARSGLSPGYNLNAGRLKTYAGQALRGVADVISSIPKTTALEQFNKPNEVLSMFDAIDQGEKIEPPGVGTDPSVLGDVLIYRKNPQAREQLRAKWVDAMSGQPKRPQDLTLYKAGQTISDTARDAVNINPKYEEEFWSQVSRGLGSTGGFAVAGLTLRRPLAAATGLPPTAAALTAASGLGAMTQATQGFEDAINHGASMDDAYTSSKLNAYIGLSEGLPIMRLLDRADKWGAGGVKRLLKDAIKQGTEEAAQEAFQLITQNLVANKIVGYDPKRDTFDGLAMNTGVGFTAGALTQILVSLVTGGRVRLAARASGSTETPPATGAQAPAATPTNGATPPTAAPTGGQPQANPAQNGLTPGEPQLGAVQDLFDRFGIAPKGFAQQEAPPAVTPQAVSPVPAAVAPEIPAVQPSIQSEAQDVSPQDVAAVQPLVAPAVAPATKPKAQAKTDDLLRFIAKNGGLSREAAQAEGLDPAHFNDSTSRQVFGKPLFPRAGGLTMDGLAELMSQAGYLPEGQYHANDALEYVARALQGQEIYSPKNAEKAYNQQAAAEFEKGARLVDHPGIEAAAADMPEYDQPAGLRFEPEEYDPEASGETRSLFELHQMAKVINEDEADAIYERVDDSIASQQEAARRFNEIIRSGSGQEAGRNLQANGQEEQRPAPQAPAAAAQTPQEVAPGETADLLGGKNAVAQAVKDAEVERQRKIDASPEMGAGAGDLFTERAKQTEIPATEKVKQRRAEQRPGERRGDIGARKRVSEMSPAEKDRELLVDHLTSMPNRRAYDESEKKPVQVAIDLDAFKWFNDNLGHPAGDKLLTAVGQAFLDHGVEAYHISGDEFIMQGTDAKALEAAATAIANRLSLVKLIGEKDGVKIVKTGIYFSYGIGATRDEADKALYRAKQDREAKGLRPAAGQEPSGVTRVPAGEQAAESGSAAGQEAGKAAASNKDETLRLREQKAARITPMTPKGGPGKEDLTQQTPPTPEGDWRNTDEQSLADALHPPKTSLPFSAVNVNNIAKALLAVKEGKIGLGKFSLIVENNMPLPPRGERGSGMLGDVYNGSLEDNLTDYFGQYLNGLGIPVLEPEGTPRRYYKADRSKNEIFEDRPGEFYIGSKYSRTGPYRAKSADEAWQQYAAKFDGRAMTFGDGLDGSAVSIGSPYLSRQPELYDVMISEFRKRPALLLRTMREDLGIRKDEDEATFEMFRAASEEADRMTFDDTPEGRRAKLRLIDGEKSESPKPSGAQGGAPSVRAQAPIPDASAEDINKAAHEAATSPKNDLPQPTEAQKEAGNYKVGKITINGLDISIENPEGSKRRPEWPTQKSHYGYIARVDGETAPRGKDKEHIDVFVKPGTSENYNGPVFVVDQANKEGAFDEHKTLLGWPDEKSARAGYLENYPKGWKGLGAITEMPLDKFKDWIKSDQTKKPLANQTNPEKRSAAPVAESLAPAPEAGEGGIAPTQAGAAPDSMKIEDFGEKIGGARKDTSQPLGQRGESAAEESNEPGWRKRFSVAEIAASSDPKEKGKWVIRDLRKKDWRGQPRQIGQPFASKEEAEKGVELAAVALKHRVVMGNPDKDGNSTYTIWRDVTDRKRVQVIKEVFKTRDDAMRYMATHATEIVETKTSFGEEILAKPDKVVRSGIERRDGPATKEMFGDTFGFRGVEFGNWNNQDERQEVMNHAYDGLLDLAEVLNVPPKALSLNGELALAFGARGQGLSGAKAHYEMDYGVINLTKMTGAGSLAHEWFHALDHYFARQDTKAKSEKVANERGDMVFPDTTPRLGFASHGFRATGSQVRPELQKAYVDLIQTMFTKAEQYVEDTQKAEKFVGGAREQLAKGLQEIRLNLTRGPEQLTYMKRNNKPASAEQLADFDQLADKILSGQDIGIQYRPNPASAGKKIGARGWMAGRQTNDTLEAMSAILKAVRGRSGFNAENSGPLDGLRYLIKVYAERIKMLESANTQETKTKRVPTSYAMENKKIDQGRASDYWTTEHEMAARAFSAYVEDKIAESGNRSDFLAYGADNNLPNYRLLNVRPFPEGAERVAINNAFDAFTDAIKTKETDKGTALFSRNAEPATGGFSASETKASLADAISNLSVPVVFHENVKAARETTGLNISDDTRGIFHGNKIHIITRKIGSRAAAQFVLWHEVNHAGIDRIYPGGRYSNADYVSAMTMISTRNANVRKAAQEWRNKHGDGYLATLKKLNIEDAKAQKSMRLLAIEEALSDLSGKQGEVIKLRGLREFISKIQAWLRSKGFDAVADWMESVSNAEALQFIQRARKYATQLNPEQDIGGEQAPAYSQSDPMFYSQMQRVLTDKLPGSAPAELMREQIGNMAKNGAFKQEEYEWSGIDQWLADQSGKVTKQQVQDFLRANEVQVKEVTLGGNEELSRLEEEQQSLSEKMDAARTKAFGADAKLDDVITPTQRANMSQWAWQAADGGAEEIRKINSLGLSSDQRAAIMEYGKVALETKNLNDRVMTLRGETNTKFAQWQVPGGENYRELLLTLPLEKPTVSTKGWTATYQGGEAWLVHDENGMQVGSTYGATDAADAIDRRARERGGSVIDKGFRSSHFDEPNILAHVRFNERTTAEGKRTLFIEEVQSDWAQKGRREGFKAADFERQQASLTAQRKEALDRIGALNDELYPMRLDKTDARANDANLPVDNSDVAAKVAERTTWLQKASELDDRLSDARFKARGSVPSAPFVGNTASWSMLAMKRMIRYAAENGYDKIAWTTGEQQAARYDLSKQVDSIEVLRNADDTYSVLATPLDGARTVTLGRSLSESALAENVGKDLAAKIVKQGNGEHTYSGLDLKVGGEGMTAFYDRMLPNEVNKYVKKWNSKTSFAFINATDNKNSTNVTFIPTDKFADFPRSTPFAVKVDGGINIELKSGLFKSSGVESGSANADTLRDFRDWHTRDDKSFGEIPVPMLLPVMDRMRLMLHDPKIADAVIRLIPIDVMNDLAGPQRSAEMLRHDPTMLADLLHPDENSNIPVPVSKAISSIIRDSAFPITEVVFGTADPMGIPKDLRPTLVTNNFHGFSPREMIDSIISISKRGNVGQGDQVHSLEITDAMRESAMAGQPLFSLRDIEPAKMAERARSEIGNLLESDRTFNRWWHKTVGTQFHKAQIDKDFGKVFNFGQDYLTDFSRYAMMAESEAPDLLTRMEGLRDVFRFGAKKAEVQAVSSAIFEGTLDDKVFSDDQLKDRGLTDKQIEYYGQARAAIGNSLDEMAKSIMAKQARAIGIEGSFIDGLRRQDMQLHDFHSELLGVMKLREKGYRELAKGVEGRLKSDFEAQAKAAADQIKATVNVFNRAAELKSQGYAPLMRFGQYTVSVSQLADGEREEVFFGMYETQAAANRAAQELVKEFPNTKIQKGILSQEAWRVFRGISPETIAVFAKAVGLDQDAAFQDYLKLAVNSRSAMKRMIHRKGTPGFSEDLQRVLAAFITSNARLTSSNYHLGDMQKAVDAIPREKGDVKDEAVKLWQYLIDPKEEAGKLRGFLFFNFLGGSVASGMVNATQPIMITAPYLAQFTSVKNVSVELGRAMKDAVINKTPADMLTDYQRAVDEGIIAPHEIYQLMAAARNSIGRSTAIARGLRVWGAFFSLAEAFNRRTTFIAAYRVAKKLGKADPYEFAKQAIYETQFIYNKGNRPDWARGTIGATIFTFKQFSISYIEAIKRMPPAQRAMALMLLWFMTGIKGLPFADDLGDVVDTIGQWLGHDTNSDKWLRKIAVKTLGNAGAEFMLHGVTALPGVPLDLQARFSMGNLIPGTSLLKPSETNKSRDVQQFLGPAGSVAGSIGGALGSAAKGNAAGAVRTLLPTSVQSALKGMDMWETGTYRDTKGPKGRRVLDVSKGEAILKMAGFQPSSVAKESRIIREYQQDINLQHVTEAGIVDKWAAGIFEHDKDKIAAAKKEMIDWNKTNPETRVVITPQQLSKRVQEMHKTRAQRFEKSVPPEMRGRIAREIRDAKNE